MAVSPPRKPASHAPASHGDANDLLQILSDIHFEPKRNVTLVRLRIDGMLHDVHVVPKIVCQARQTSSMEIFEAARGEGMRTLHEAAVEKVLNGTTTVSEMVRVTGA
jgi:type II secretory ATPase GspE/PulE/Tfp pilus assembly ATPase PilB-like protein